MDVSTSSSSCRSRCPMLICLTDFTPCHTVNPNKRSKTIQILSQNFDCYGVIKGFLVPVPRTRCCRQRVQSAVPPESLISLVSCRCRHSLAGQHGSRISHEVLLLEVVHRRCHRAIFLSGCARTFFVCFYFFPCNLRIHVHVLL